MFYLLQNYIFTEELKIIYLQLIRNKNSSMVKLNQMAQCIINECWKPDIDIFIEKINDIIIQMSTFLNLNGGNIIDKTLTIIK